MSAQPTNRLAQEKSPYLLQHAHNPVDWFAWNAAAFAQARTENKPIFLSIGYSTCHWCHVMERESFEDEKIGAFLNAHFVSIKVDREERPDVDKIYMPFVQSTAGGGGWPLNVFLTPELKPFFGGTYFPPDARSGRPSFLQLLEQIAGLWRERKLEIVASADELHARLELITARDARENSPLTPPTLQRAAEMFNEAFDPVNGGFGGAPKFPQPSIPSLLLRAAKRFGDDAAVKMVLHTCDQMAAGGIHDQLGGGFARYAVDAEWLVPHFEKMLYDNAQLAQLYLDAHLISAGRVPRVPDSTTGKSLGLVPPPESLYAATARDILDYVLRDLTHPGGGFYSAEDADSEGHEGKFYCWTKAELSQLLTVEEFNVAANYFGITAEGNFVDHSHPTPLAGQNVLSVVNHLTPALSRGEREKPFPASGKLVAVSGANVLTPTEVGPRLSPLPAGEGQGEGVSASDQQLLPSAKAKMLAARAQRIRPHLDDKILASWNGLMLGAFARAAAVLGEEKYRAAAEKNFQFIREKLWEPPVPSAIGHRPSAIPGTLFHRWRDGEHDQVQLLEGYAFLLDGVIQLYEATLEPKPLDFAIELAEAMLAKFYDPANGGFWQSPVGSSDLILRVKDDYDGAEPSGNSVATLALLKLAALTGREDFRSPAEATLQLFAHRLQNQPAAMAFMLQALDFWLDEPRRVVIVGDPNSTSFHELLRAAHSVYLPNKIVLSPAGAVEPFAKTLTAKGEAQAFVCTGTACQPPANDAETLRQQLLQ